MSKNNNRNNNQQVKDEPVLVEEESTGPDEIIETTEEVKPPVAPEPVPNKEIVKPMTTTTLNLEPTKVNPLALFMTQYQKELTTTKSEQVAATVQFSFFNKVLEILNKDSFEDTMNGLNTILKHIHNGRQDGLDETNLFRGAAHWEGTPEDYSTFRRLMWLFIETANPQTRKTKAAKVDLTSIEQGLTVKQYNNLISFYG